MAFTFRTSPNGALQPWHHVVHLGLALRVSLDWAFVCEASSPVPEAPLTGSPRFLQHRGAASRDSSRIFNNPRIPDAGRYPQDIACSPYAQWPNIDNGVTCGRCTALVSTRGYGGRCSKYCESFGHACVAAAEEVDETCGVRYTSSCDERIAGTSDMLCTCASAPSTPVPDSGSYPEQYACADFPDWPSIDRGVTCGGCTALVRARKYSGRCDKYCESFGHVCVAAAEEVDETCEVKYTISCDTEIVDTSDMLCTCTAAPSTPVTTPGSYPAAPVPKPGPSAEQSDCADFADWPLKNVMRTCGGCTALVWMQDYEGSCGRYCKGFGHKCLMATEEEDNSCVANGGISCYPKTYDDWPRTDMLCTCTYDAP